MLGSSPAEVACLCFVHMFFGGCLSVCAGCLCFMARAGCVLCACLRGRHYACERARRTRRRWWACVHACRMTFREMWQWEKKHLTHNWSAMKEIWSWICIGLTCSALKTSGGSRREHAHLAIPLSRHTEGLLQCSECAKKKKKKKDTWRIQGEQSWWQNW